MAAIPFRIRAGDTYPPFLATVLENGVAKDVSSGTVTVNVRRKTGSKATIVAGGAASFVSDGTNGEITFSFSAAQSANPGKIEIEVEVDFGAGSVGTWPSDGYYPGEIVNSID
jgi:hypothetical protein